MLVTRPSSSYTDSAHRNWSLFGIRGFGRDHMVFGGNGGDVSCFLESLVEGGMGATEN